MPRPSSPRQYIVAAMLLAVLPLVAVLSADEAK